MRIGGIIDISTKDIPNKACMVIFTVGCNFKCNSCQNKHLLQKDAGKVIKIDDLVKKIKSNVLVNSISISGGEPTLQKELRELCKEINKIEKYLSVDTNGSNPDVIKEIIPYVNRIALDIKGPLNKSALGKIIGVNTNPEAIIETFQVLNDNKKIDFEVRTTYVENLMIPSDIEEIISFLIEQKFRGNFVLQQYQYSDGVGEKFENEFQKPEHLTLLNLLKPYRFLRLPFKIFLRDDIIGYCDIDQITDNLEKD